MGERKFSEAQEIKSLCRRAADALRMRPEADGIEDAVRLIRTVTWLEAAEQVLNLRAESRYGALIDSAVASERFKLLATIAGRKDLTP